MKPPSTNFSTGSLPEALTAIPQWVVWYPCRREDEWTKMPYDPKTATTSSLEKAKTNHRTTWSDYETAVKVARETEHGIGFVLTEDLGITGVDLDHCIKGRRLTPWVRDLVRQLDTYTEVSPSGTGLRMFAYGTIPKALKRSEQGLELYKTGRFLTITGQHVSSTSRKIEERPEAVAALYDAFAPVIKVLPPPPPRTDRQTRSDTELVTAIGDSNQSAKFTRLFQGDDTGFGSASEADMSLACILCWWTDDDAQVDAIMRSSGLAREKYSRPDYLRRTISRARRIVG